MKECFSDTQTNEQEGVCNLSTLSEAEKKPCTSPPQKIITYIPENRTWLRGKLILHLT